MSEGDGTIPIESAQLLGDLLTASMGASFDTMDSLYEGERRRRQALEVHLDNLRDRVYNVSGGSARDYEDALGPLWEPVDPDLADYHPENVRKR